MSASTGPDLKVLPDPATLGYEQARDELVAVVQRLEAGGEPLETSLALWERGEALAARCQQWLDGARERLESASRPARANADDDAASAAERGGARDRAYEEDGAGA